MKKVNIKEIDEKITKKSPPTKREVYDWLAKNALVILGTVILAFGSAVFLIPFDLVMGGTSGMAIIIKSLIPSGVPVDTVVNVSVAIITWSLFFVGLIFLGKDFAAKTLLSTIVYPLAFPLLSLRL